MKRITTAFVIILLIGLSACSSAAPVPTETVVSATPEPTAVHVDTLTPTDIPLIPSATADSHFSPEVQEFAIGLVEDGKVPGIAIGLAHS